jgi:hypothetical protein
MRKFIEKKKDEIKELKKNQELSDSKRAEAAKMIGVLTKERDSLKQALSVASAENTDLQSKAKDLRKKNAAISAS